MELIFAKEELKVTSPAFREGEAIPARYTCDGEDLFPPLSLAGVPLSAESLVLIVDDPDSPNGTWTHFVRFNLPPPLNDFREGQDPGGGMGLTTASGLEWHGPCPHQGEHRYYFKVYALSAKLDLPDGVSAEEVEAAMDGKVLAKASLMGRYRRAATES